MTGRRAIVAPVEAHRIAETEWGRLVWMVARELGNSETMTIGRCYIHPQHETPRHYHPNCDEVVHVLEGTIEHTCDSETVALRPGDAISIPAGVIHNTRNVGDDRAVLLIAFSAADRQTVGA